MTATTTTTTRSRKHDLTVTPMFAHGHGQSIVGVNVKTSVRAFEEIGWKRVRGKGGIRRYRLAGQSRAVIRFHDPKSRRYATLVFSLGEARAERAAA